jgi:hypothetical protein
MTTPGPQNDPDALWRHWLGEVLTAAAQQFTVTLTGPPAYGWRDRSTGAAAATSSGEPRWLRAVTEDTRWAHGDFWTGNADANTITGIPKPVVLGITEWQEGPRRVRAELMTLIPGHPVSPAGTLTSTPRLPHAWFAALRRSLDILAATPTTRVCVDRDTLTRRIRTRLGIETDPATLTWTTAHGDLHWANLHAPRLAVLDWEGWGQAPAGLDAATLYCYSLTEPATARRVRTVFRDILTTPAGITAQQYVIARLLDRADTGDHPQLTAPLQTLARTLQNPAGAT